MLKDNSCSWVLLAPSEEGGEKAQTLAVRQVAKQTRLFSNGESLIYSPPSTQAVFRSVDIV